MFTTQTDDLARITSFADAKKYWNETKPIRGKDPAEHGKPLRFNRRQLSTKSIHELNNGAAYAMRLYDTDCVIFHDTGVITFNLEYNSLSTNNFLGWFCPALVHFDTADKVIRGDKMFFKGKLLADIEREHKQEDMYVGDWLEIPVATSIDTEWEGNRIVSIDSVTPAYKAYVDKSKASEVRKTTVPLMNYLNMLIATNAKIDFGRTSGHDRQAAILDYLDDPTDVETWFSLFTAFHTYDFVHHNGTYQREFKFDLKSLKTALYKHLYKDNDLYTLQRLPLGYLVRGWVRN